MKKQGLVTLLALLTFNAQATPHPYIVTGTDMVSPENKSMPSYQVIEQAGDSIIAQINEHDKGYLAEIAHEEKHRCGGYFAFKTLDEAKSFVKNFKANDTTKAVLTDYTINQEDLVNEYITKTSEISIRSTIEKLSSFKNRYYKSRTGQESQEWLKSHWETIVAHRKDASVSLFKHSSWPQPSVIATIKGQSDDIIVVGGHADSISGWFGRETAHAPGADDNASGTATVTEALKVLANSNYVPQKTIMFMAYAAEEVGLLGSKDIAQTFKRDGKNVIGVLQLDMTNFHGSSNQDITVIADYTNQAQNDFLGALIDKYLPELTWGRDKCGYACSDHASWTSQGYPASTPFESKKNDMNRRIHTAKDTLDNMGGTADHALKFAKLATAFIIELDR